MLSVSSSSKMLRLAPAVNRRMMKAAGGNNRAMLAESFFSTLLGVCVYVPSIETEQEGSKEDRRTREEGRKEERSKG